MNKETWKLQFESAISDLSEDERRRATDYYDELYLDKIDEGFTEEGAIASFGAPETCAKRIRNGLKMTGFDDVFDGFNKKSEEKRGGTDYWEKDEQAAQGEKPSSESYGRTDYWENPNRQSGSRDGDRQNGAKQTRPRKKDNFASILVNILLMIIAIAAVIVLWSVAIGVAIAVYSFAVAAVSCVIGAIALAFVNAYVFLAALGVALLLAGISILLIPLVNKMFRYLSILCGKLFFETEKVVDSLRSEE